MSDRDRERPLAVITLGSVLRFLADILIAAAGVTIGQGLPWWWVLLGVAAGLLRAAAGPEQRDADR